MKSSSRIMPGTVLFLGIVAIMLVGLLGYGRAKDSPTEVDNKTTSINDCGNDRQCFYQAFTDTCSLATIRTTERTIEGDPIMTTAKLFQDQEGCSIEIVVDGSQDKFGDGKTHAYSCKKLIREDQRLMASGCKGRGETAIVFI